MAQPTDGQVQLEKLLFTQNWEDPKVDESALSIQEGDSVFVITSGCCNALGFLRFNPEKIYCSDINAAQNHLMELKQAAFRRLNYAEFLDFAGLGKSIDRAEVYHGLRGDLSTEAAKFWDEHSKIVKRGWFMNGRYERFVRLVGKMIRLLQGNGNTKRLFQQTSLSTQLAFFENNWDNGRWRWLFRVMFNKKRLAKRGLDADYFHFDDGSSSFSESFQRRAKHAMVNLPIKENYFLSLYLLGTYLSKEFIPPYLQEANFATIKKNIDRISVFTADAKYWLAKQTPNTFDAMALSNICELMDLGDTEKFFQEVLRTGKEGARIIFRNLMVPREVPESLRKEIVKDVKLSEQLQYNDRSFVYGKVAAYTIKKS